MVYSEQAASAKQMSPTLREVSDFLHGKRLYGPIGINVVEDGQGGQYNIVDLNVRTASSVVAFSACSGGTLSLGVWIMLVCGLLKLE